MENLVKMLFEVENNIKLYKGTYWPDMSEIQFQMWSKGLKAIKKTRKEIKNELFKTIIK